MMKTESIYKYILEPSGNGRKYHPCPHCGAYKFTYYIDRDTGKPLADYVGRCERINSCGYHYPPREYFRNLNSIMYLQTVVTQYFVNNKSEIWS